MSDEANAAVELADEVLRAGVDKALAGVKLPYAVERLEGKLMRQKTPMLKLGVGKDRLNKWVHYLLYRVTETGQVERAVLKGNKIIINPATGQPRLVQESVKVDLDPSDMTPMSVMQDLITFVEVAVKR